MATQFEGIVQEARPNQLFRIEADDGRTVLATLSPALRQRIIKIIPGDRVTIEVSPFDPSRGRIVERHP